MPRKLSAEDYIKILRKEHPGLYTYKVSPGSGPRGILAVCRKHGEFVPNVRNRSTLCLCPKCSHEVGNAKKRSMTVPEFLAKAKEIRGDKITGFKKLSKIIQCGAIPVKCAEHGWVKASPKNILDKSRNFCIKCKNAASGAELAMTSPEFRERVAARWPGKLILAADTTYPGMNRDTPVICPQHGRQMSTPARLLPKTWKVQQDNWCMRCTWEASNSKKRKHTDGTFLAWLKHKFGDTVSDYSRAAWSGVMQPVELKCPTHGWQRPLAQTLEFNDGAKPWCTECLHHSYRKITCLEDVRKVITERFGSDSAVSVSPRNPETVEFPSRSTARREVLLTCRHHGDFLCKLGRLTYGDPATPPCHKCAYKVSKPHVKINALLEELGVSSNQNYRAHGMRYKDSGYPFELDVFVPIKKVAVEINGVYWHSHSRDSNLTRNKHRAKAEKCREQGIRLLQFWDTQILNPASWRIIRSMVAHALGVTSKVVYARNTRCGPLTKEQAAQFYEKHHLQGSAPMTNSSVSYGLVSRDAKGRERLVAAATFDKPRFSKKYEWELLRMASFTNLSIPGAASKLHAAFTREHAPADILTYANALYSDAGVYEKLGYLRRGYSAPSYVWVHPGSGTVKSRYQTQKHKLEDLLESLDMGYDPDASETENMRANGFFKVSDAGNHVLEWTSATRANKPL